MKRRRTILLVGAILAVTTAPAWANWRTDFRYASHYLFLQEDIEPDRTTLTSIPELEATALSPGYQSEPWCSSSWDLDGWDFDILGGIGLYDIDHLGRGGFNVEGDVTNLDLGIFARRNRWLWRASIYNQDFDGKGTNGSGLDQEINGITLRPGYQLLDQKNYGVNLSLHALLDLSYTTTTGFGANPSTWYVTPGLGVDLNHVTKYGIFRCGYTYTQLTNVDGEEDELTGRDKINSHAGSLDYLALITDNIYGSAGLSHIKMDDLPNGMDDEYTDFNLRFGTAFPECFNLDLGYSWAIDGRNSTAWKLRARLKF